MNVIRRTSHFLICGALSLICHESLLILSLVKGKAKNDDEEPMTGCGTPIAVAETNEWRTSIYNQKGSTGP
jgi:hypothetical protein